MQAWGKCRSWCTWRNDTDFCELHCAALDCIALHCTLKVTPLVLLAEEGGRKGGTHVAPCLCMYAGSSDAQLRAEQASARLSAYLQMYAELLSVKLLSVKLHTAGARWYSHSAMHYAS